jgi:farnesyl diphosphate synthase
VDAVLAQWGEISRTEWPGALGDAVAYSLASPGKRLRPALVMAAHGALDGTGDVTELAAAVEVVHTYSLVHDDLPCMDDDDLRRGRPTTHRAFDVPIAVEAGFRMVRLAGRLLASGAARVALAAPVLSAMGRELFAAVGGDGMIGGQVLDLAAEGRALHGDELIAIHRAKTGRLITASAVIGALAAGATPDRVAALRDYGADVGLAFQIVDDILDATGTSAELGKTAGKDARQGKATFATVFGADKAVEEAERLAARAIDRIGSVAIDSPLLCDLATFVVTRRS